MIPASRLSTRRGAPHFGTLSIHLDPSPCAVGCAFCYLGAREGAGALDEGAWRAALAAALSRATWDELAIALSDPIVEARPRLAFVVEQAKMHGAPVAVTTTLSIAERAPELLGGIARVNLSVDPDKGRADLEVVRRVCDKLALHAPTTERVLIVSLQSEAFARDLIDKGGLEALLAEPLVDKVVLNAVKPPPAWCDRAFWLRAMQTLAPSLAAHLDRKLFLDCYVAARILKLGDCPARPDLSATREGIAFRACVYQPRADFTFLDGDAFVRRAQDFRAPDACPFPIP